jgi:ammonium transporter, Amt family
MIKKLASLAGMAALCLCAPLAAHAQENQPAAVVAEAAAKPQTSVSEEIAELKKQVADLNAIQTNSAPSPDGPLSKTAAPAHNAWIMVSAGLVLFMTLPGLALFYGGLVRRKNVLSILAQCLGLTAVVTVIWWAVGYSLAFGKGGWLGGLEFAFFKNVEFEPNATYSTWVSHNIWAIYQLTFAIITPALTIGALAERMKFSAVMLFSVLWMFVVYFPAAHLFWGDGGHFNGVWNAAAKIQSIDFAGGIVVHITSGWSALILCVLLGKRRNYGRIPMPPHSMVLCMAGTGMLWVGWYGFNAGSAVAADRVATTAFVSTTLSAAVGCVVWGAIEWIHRGKPSVLGLCSGAVAGLATITPASGFVSPSSAVIVGLFAGVTTWFACAKLKGWLGYDDALDTFGVHAVGGTVGTILAGVFADPKYNPNLATNLGSLCGNGLWIEQLKAVGISIVWSVGASAVLFFIVKAVIGVRPSVEDEEQGLDLADHGEEGYIEG